MSALSRVKECSKSFLKSMRKLRFKGRKPENTDVSILCNCCIGGHMYHDMGIKFLSPTINLFFAHHCFIDYMNHLKEYQDAELIDSGKFDEGTNGKLSPIGILKKDGLPDIELHFLHYDSFGQASQKWKERSKRINYKKIFLVIEARDDHEHELIDEYAALPYPKVIFTNLPDDPEKSVMHMKVYDNGQTINQFVGCLGKRGFDQFDFVEEIFNRKYE